MGVGRTDAGGKDLRPSPAAGALFRDRLAKNGGRRKAPRRIRVRFVLTPGAPFW